MIGTVLIRRSVRRALRTALSIAIVGIFVVAELTFSQDQQQMKQREPLAAILQERLNNHMIEQDRAQRQEEQFRDLVRQQTLANTERIRALEAVADVNARWLQVIGVSIILMALKEILLFSKSRKSDR